MKDLALLIGNGVNTISKGITWDNLLDNLLAFCKDDCSIKDKQKPFPLFYEEIFLNAFKRRRIVKELDLKKFIAQNVSRIEANEIHELIRNIAPAHVITTNYDFLLEGSEPQKNDGLIYENLYSIFRRYEIGTTTFWHIHGDCRSPMSINLGYEHYGGQLQKMRNYATSKPEYKSDRIVKRSLVKRLQQGNELEAIQSWIDLFFVKNIHIIGLTLDFVETDLWWLLTYRARQLLYKQKIKITNKITYYIPEAFVKTARFKLDLLKANGVEIKVINRTHGISYYKEILSSI